MHSKATAVLCHCAENGHKTASIAITSMFFVLNKK